MDDGRGEAGPNAQQPTSSTEPFEYSSIQISLPPAINQAIVAYASTIPDGDLAGRGRTEQPHLTVKQRLLTKEPRDVIALLDGERTFSVTFGQTHAFRTPEFDIVHVDVTGDRLLELHEKLNSLQHCDPHATYHPHVTVAFVQAGRGASYARNAFLAGLSVPVRSLTYSGFDGTVVEIPMEWSEDA
jgi:2'-5' RNA ligase